MAEDKAKTQEEAKPKAKAKKKTVTKIAKLTVVRFTKSHAPYHKGEIAGFNAKDAKQLIEVLKVAKKK